MVAPTSGTPRSEARERARDVLLGRAQHDPRNSHLDDRERDDPAPAARIGRRSTLRTTIGRRIAAAMAVRPRTRPPARSVDGDPDEQVGCPR
jgi:hypothetical protein